VKINLSSPEEIAKILKDAIGDIATSADSGLDKSLESVSRQAFEKAKELAAARLNRTKQQYIDALSLEQLGPNIYAVRLDGSAAHIDRGFDSYDMKPGLLKNAKKRSKRGYRYRAIPMEQSGAPAKSAHPLNSRPVQFIGRNENGQMKLPMGSTTQGSLSSDFNALKKLGNRFAKDNLPQNFTGKAWTASQDPLNKNTAVFNLGNGQQFRANLNRPFNPMMAGLTNVRAQHENSPNKVRSAYITFRMVSEDPKHKGKWIHPGYNGAHILPDVQKFTEESFSRMVEAIFKDAA